MEQQIKAYIEKYHMIDRGDKVLVGLSGGADSVCLLFVLLNLRAELGIELEAVHVHHGLRGKSADEDEAYVRDLCRQQNVVLHVHRADIRAYALERGLGEEEAGREVRRQVFTELLKEREGSKIALAHHKNDNAETLIWNLCRGCGLKGAGGLKECGFVHFLRLVGWRLNHIWKNGEYLIVRMKQIRRTPIPETGSEAM